MIVSILTAGPFRFVQYRFNCNHSVFGRSVIVRYGTDALSEESLIATMFFTIDLGEFGLTDPEQSEAR